MKIYSYIRVPTRDQNMDQQHEILKEYAESNNIKYDAVFEDKITGKNYDRPQYKALKGIVKRNDMVVIKELDRLGKNFMEIPKELQYFFEKGVKIIILDTPLVSTGNEELDYAINSMIINFLYYIVDKKRDRIIKNIKEGLRAAKSKGKKLGRPRRKLPKDFEKYYKKWKEGTITAVEFSKLIRVSRSTLYRYIKDYKL